MNKNFLLAIGFLAGTIIGAGIFSLPYVFSQLGLLNGFFYLIFFAFVYFAVYLMYAKLVQTSKEEHRFFYLAKKFLPKRFSGFASVLVLGGLLLTLTIYLILAPTFFELITDIPGFSSLLVFWVAGSVFIFVKLSWQGLAEFFGAVGIIAIVAIIFGVGGTSSLEVPFFKGLNMTSLFLPFGPLLFAFAARSAIPKVVDEYRVAKRSGKSFPLGKAIFLGTFIPVIVYALFVVGILRLSSSVSPEALNSLSFLSSEILTLIGIMGLLTLWTSYFMIGANVREMLKNDLRAPGWLSALVVLSAPLVFYFAGFQNFLTAVSFTGGVFLGLEGIFVISMWRKAFPQASWRWVSWPLYLVFSVALVYAVVTFVF